MGIFAALHQRGFLENFVIDVDSMRFSRCFVFLGFQRCSAQPFVQTGQKLLVRSRLSKKAVHALRAEGRKVAFLDVGRQREFWEWAEFAPESAIEAA